MILIFFEKYPGRGEGGAGGHLLIFQFRKWIFFAGVFRPFVCLLRQILWFGRLFGRICWLRWYIVNKIGRFLPCYFPRNCIEIIRWFAVCVADGPFANLRCILIFSGVVRQEALIFFGYFPCHLFRLNIPVIWMAGVGVNTLCPICVCEKERCVRLELE